MIPYNREGVLISIEGDGAWSAVVAGLEHAPDVDDIHDELLALLEALVGPSTQRDSSHHGRIDAFLADKLPWYRACTMFVGDEARTSWCWCHSYLSTHATNERSAVLAQTAQSILDELELIETLLRNLEAVYASVELPEDHGDALLALHHGMTRVIDTYIMVGINDSWYPQCAWGLGWLLQAKGYAVDDDLYEAISHIVGVRFTSWSQPSRSEICDAAEEATWASVKRMFREYYDV